MSDYPPDHPRSRAKHAYTPTRDPDARALLEDAPDAARDRPPAKAQPRRTVNADVLRALGRLVDDVRLEALAEAKGLAYSGLTRHEARDAFESYLEVWGGEIDASGLRDIHRASTGRGTLAAALRITGDAPARCKKCGGFLTPGQVVDGWAVHPSCEGEEDAADDAPSDYDTACRRGRIPEWQTLDTLTAKQRGDLMRVRFFGGRRFTTCRYIGHAGDAWRFLDAALAEPWVIDSDGWEWMPWPDRVEETP